MLNYQRVILQAVPFENDGSLGHSPGWAWISGISTTTTRAPGFGAELGLGSWALDSRTGNPKQ